MNEIMIHVDNREVPVPVREYDGKRFVTFREVDTVHGRPEGTAKRNFRTNRNRFIQGEDYYKIPLTEFRAKFVPNSICCGNPHTEVVLLTEQGYLLLMKSFTDDLAWSVQRQLVGAYFRTAQPALSDQLEQFKADFMTALDQKLDTVTASLERLIQAPKPVSDPSKEWKDQMIPLIKALVKDHPERYETYSTVFKTVYDRMTRDYGFVADQARKDYMSRYESEKTPSRFECVSRDPVWSSIFHSILVNLGEEARGNDKTSTIPDKTIKETIAPLIAARGDGSVNGCRTYKIVFDYMDNKLGVRWGYMVGAYKRSHSKKRNPTKTELVNEYPKLHQAFAQAVAELLEEVRRDHD